MQIATIETRLGRLQILASKHGLYAINLLDTIDTLGEENYEERRIEGLVRLQTRYPNRQPAAGEVLTWVKGLERLANGEGLATSELPPHDFGNRGTEKQREVWQQLIAIPRGETISYTEMARRIGLPTAVRPAAAACGANPLPILIPCHRVVSISGGLGGFGFGLERKRLLLEWEKL